nr:integrase, catalytic region, zinc finger, CCHC-type, peptidase aspartic, catalytic [Tanacetum cinerariifolium]
KGKCKDTSCVSDTQNQVFQKLENANMELEFQNTKFAKQPIAEILPKIGETNALSKTVTSNSVSTPQEPKGVNNDKVIAPGMFRISPDKIPRKAKKVPNTLSESARTKPITVSQPSVITKKGINSNSNGLSSTGLDNTKTRRQQPRSNTKNDRVLSASKSSRSKNKEVKVEEHHRNLLLSKNNKHMSSACNSYKIDSSDVKSKVVCVNCKTCLNSVNHDVCLNNCVNGKKSRGRKHKANSRGRKHKANVSKNETQKEYRPKVSNSKNVGTRESLATPKPRKPRFLLRWSPTGRLFDQDGKLVASSNFESQVDCSNGDNACTSNAMEPKPKVTKPNKVGTLERLATPKPRKPRFLLRWSPTGRLFDQEGKLIGSSESESQSDCSNGDNACTSNAMKPKIKRFLNSTSLLDRVYFVEGFGHNLFSVGQFCDSDLEVAFRRNSCFVRNLERVDLLKGDRSTNLYTFNLHEMASASPICLMARASSTKSWLWHQ